MAYGIDIEEEFAFHPATPLTGPQHDKIRALLRDTAHRLDELTPPSALQTLAIRKVQEAMFYANASVAVHGAPTREPDSPE